MQFITRTYLPDCKGNELLLGSKVRVKNRGIMTVARHPINTTTFVLRDSTSFISLNDVRLKMIEILKPILEIPKKKSR